MFNAYRGMKMRILIVDDEPDIRELLKLYLELDGRFDLVGEGTNGEEAVELAGSTHPHAIILDVNMPIMNGFEAIPLIRDKSPDSKILLYSAYSDSTRLVESSMTADDWVSKTDPVDKLLERLMGLTASSDVEAAS